LARIGASKRLPDRSMYSRPVTNITAAKTSTNIALAAGGILRPSPSPHRSIERNNAEGGLGVQLYLSGCLTDPNGVPNWRNGFFLRVAGSNDYPIPRSANLQPHARRSNAGESGEGNHAAMRLARYSSSHPAVFLRRRMESLPGAFRVRL